MDLIALAEVFETLSPSALMFKILSDRETEAFIVGLNTDKQLGTDHIDSTGVKLYEIGGEYSARTVKTKPTNNPKDVNLYDTGRFYKTFGIDPKRNLDFDLEADTNVHGTDLTKRWGEKIVGLTDENIQLLIEYLEERFFKAIEKLL